jgi:hypothetical protein
MQDSKDISAGRTSTGLATKGLRVLFLPKNSRTAYFQSLLAAARADLDWQTHVVCPDFERQVWRNAVDARDAFHPLPEFSERQAWEDDPGQIAEIDSLIGECERASGVSAGRIVLTGERDIGRGFSRSFYYWFHNRIARRVLADNTEPFRIVRRIFAFARETLDASNPDLVLAGEWADPVCFTFYLVARRMGIRCVVNRPSKIWSGRCYWSEDLQWHNMAARNRVAVMRASSASVSVRSRERIANFRSAPTTLGYVRRNWDADERRRWLASHIDLFRLLAAQLRHFFSKHSGPSPKPALRLAFEHYRRPLLKWRQARFFRSFSADALRQMRYLYIALHKDPEQALNGQAPFWGSQYNTVALLCSVLPDGYKLLVREHRRNAGRRPTRFYRDLSRLPGLILVDAFDDQFKYISNAGLIVTENGSTGWEGLLLGRRVITLADNFYQAAGLARRVHDPEQLPNTVVEMLQQSAVKDATAHDQALGWQLDAEWETTVPLDDEHAALDLLDEMIKPRVRSPRVSSLA